MLSDPLCAPFTIDELLHVQHQLKTNVNIVLFGHLVLILAFIIVLFLGIKFCPTATTVKP